MPNTRESGPRIETSAPMRAARAVVPSASSNRAPQITEPRIETTRPMVTATSSSDVVLLLLQLRRLRRGDAARRGRPGSRWTLRLAGLRRGPGRQLLDRVVVLAKGRRREGRCRRPVRTIRRYRRAASPPRDRRRRRARRAAGRWRCRPPRLAGPDGSAAVAAGACRSAPTGSAGAAITSSSAAAALAGAKPACGESARASSEPAPEDPITSGRPQERSVARVSASTGASRDAVAWPSPRGAGDPTVTLPSRGGIAREASCTRAKRP